jgi:hypothetical protein
MPTQNLQKLEAIKNRIAVSGLARVTFGPRKEFFINVVTEKRGTHEISLADFEALAAHTEGVRTATLLAMKFLGTRLTEIAPPTACGCALPPALESPPSGGEVGQARSEPSIGFGFLAELGQVPQRPKSRRPR